MKKLLIILVALLWCNVGVSAKSINELQEEACKKKPDDPKCKAIRKKAFEAKKSNSLNNYLNEGYKITSEELVKGERYLLTIFVLKRRGSIVICKVDHFWKKTTCRKP
tara:strand:- start:52 stop:375 length:324 start_codon:yes stop_codon:yes gene_type:complete